MIVNSPSVENGANPDIVTSVNNGFENKKTRRPDFRNERKNYGLTFFHDRIFCILLHKGMVKYI
jgi:hypothetical protein